ncbi:hypothetical protein ASPWEDRAFT_135255 [Aspergillus wentii DTO 134E9]|uniref:Glycosyl hydrolase family 32 N-terminal domain-containing protein n=1 Tax=Aspergillus wentii DTO 134E9 TaxID=1073089 RepID=A0A1L9RFN5_ASPWE|nr:uncharacterized protein ASPWEDRAFT_135255 [Aspergillus wentii DTO 134E9]OJJ33732.1 hypothetical protein ASPWEDRAFT_135255 [Aspergillus wentii DTO 134E9]
MRLSLLVSAVSSLSAAVVAADYSGPLRPQVHYSPPSGFMNDPNGLFFDQKKGVYHLYYQYNPNATVAGNQHWGHATSPDLYHWTNQPIALAPDSPDHYIFSGSAVIDSENTSGFFPNQTDGVVAIYTVDSPEVENQHIAYSRDGGYTFTKYANNPVLNSTSKDFRDPQVVWHPETGKWVMTIAYAHDRVIGFYTSPNLKNWTHASNFTTEIVGEEFECPNLVKFNVEAGNKHALFISVNPGAPLGGSGTFYVVGDFNGTHFSTEATKGELISFGKDNYAAQFYSELPEKSDPISIGWASNWQYTQDVPTGPLEGWRSAMTVPTVHRLVQVDGKWELSSLPFDISSVQGDSLASKDTTGDDVSVDFSTVKSNAVYFDVAINDIPNKPTGEVTFNFTSSTSRDFLDGGIHLDTGLFWINRAGTLNYTTANNPDFTPTVNTTVSPLGDSFAFSGVIDRSVFEVYLAEGKYTGTVDFFPSAPLNKLTVSVGELSQKTTVHVDAWGLKSGFA